MMIKFYNQSDYNEWDDFVKKSYNGTFLHTRKFLDYHKNRFIDKSILIYDYKEKLIAIFPAAIDLENKKYIVSHPGITYGGLITNKLYGIDVLNIIKIICEFYEKNGFEKIIYKSVPYIYHKKYAQDDLYSLYRLNSKRIRCDLSATIKIDSGTKFRKATKWMINRANKYKLTIEEGIENIDDYWELLTKNLFEKYNTSPIHSIDEIKDLMYRFPNNIKCIVCKLEYEVLAGIVLFETDTLYHAQYIANNDKGKEYGALEFLINEIIEICKKEGKKYFDFGTNNENQGNYLNQSLYKFKRGFDSGGVVYETYELNLKEV